MCGEVFFLLFCFSKKVYLVWSIITWLWTCYQGSDAWSTRRDKTKLWLLYANKCLCIEAGIWKWWQINLHRNLHLWEYSNFYECLKLKLWQLGLQLVGLLMSLRPRTPHGRNANSSRQLEISYQSVDAYTTYDFQMPSGNIFLLKRMKKVNKWVLFKLCILISRIPVRQEPLRR